MTPEERAEIERRHPGAAFVRLSDGREFVFKPATTGDWRRVRAAYMAAQAGNTQGLVGLFELIARGLCVHPSQADFDKLRDEAPAIADQIGENLVAKVGSHVAVSLGEP